MPLSRCNCLSPYSRTQQSREEGMGDLLMSIASIDHPAGGFMERLSKIFMAANVVGIAISLILASRGWRILQEREMISLAGESFVCVLALPTLGVFVLIDAAWGVFLLRNKNQKGVLWWALIAVSWFVALGVDFSHHSSHRFGPIVASKSLGVPRSRRRDLGDYYSSG